MDCSYLLQIWCVFFWMIFLPFRSSPWIQKTVKHDKLTERRRLRKSSSDVVDFFPGFFPLKGAKKNGDKIWRLVTHTKNMKTQLRWYKIIYNTYNNFFSTSHGFVLDVNLFFGCFFASAKARKNCLESHARGTGWEEKGSCSRRGEVDLFFPFWSLIWSLPHRVRCCSAVSGGQKGASGTKDSSVPAS